MWVGGLNRKSHRPVLSLPLKTDLFDCFNVAQTSLVSECSDLSVAECKVPL